MGPCGKTGVKNCQDNPSATQARLNPQNITKTQAEPNFSKGALSQKRKSPKDRGLPSPHGCFPNAEASRSSENGDDTEFDCGTGTTRGATKSSNVVGIGLRLVLIVLFLIVRLRVCRRTTVPVQVASRSYAGTTYGVPQIQCRMTVTLTTLIEDGSKKCQASGPVGHK